MVTAVQRNPALAGTVNTNPYQSTTQPVAGAAPQRGDPTTQSAFPSSPAPTPSAAPAPQQQASPSAPSGGGTTQYNGGLNDVNGITAWIASQAGGAGINPSVGSDPAYWLRRIQETGGLSNANTDYWIGLMKRPEGAPEGSGGSAGGASGAYVPGQGVPGQGTIFGAGQGVNPQVSALEQQLLQRAGQDVTPNANDPVIKNQVDAFNAQQQQASRNYLSGVAEKAGPNSNIGAETRLANQQIGQATGGFEAQLMGQELSARRQEVQQALQGAQGLLTAEQQMQLQEELQQLNLAQNAYQSDQQFSYLNSPFASGAMTG